MSWQTGSNTTEQVASVEDQLAQAQRDIVIMNWRAAKERAKEANREELELRAEVVAACFAEAKKGTNTLELGNGYKLKYVKKFNYKVDHDNAASVQDNIETLSEKGRFLSPRLFSWSARLSESEYNRLNPKSPDDAAILDELNKVIVISDATPELKLDEPDAN